MPQYIPQSAAQSALHVTILIQAKLIAVNEIMVCSTLTVTPGFENVIFSMTLRILTSFWYLTR